MASVISSIVLAVLTITAGLFVGVQIGLVAYWVFVYFAGFVRIMVLGWFLRIDHDGLDFVTAWVCSIALVVLALYGFDPSTPDAVIYWCGRVSFTLGLSIVPVTLLLWQWKDRK